MIELLSNICRLFGVALNYSLYSAVPPFKSKKSSYTVSQITSLTYNALSGQDVGHLGPNRTIHYSIFKSTVNQYKFGNPSHMDGFILLSQLN